MNIFRLSRLRRPAGSSRSGHLSCCDYRVVPIADATQERAQYLRTIFDAIPLPTLVVDEDVRIKEFNAAAAPLLGAKPEQTLQLRGGDALHCIYSEPYGCGQNEPCKHCVIRNSVNLAINDRATHREIHKAKWRTGEVIASIDLRITTSPLPDLGCARALLILEDVSELFLLRSLLPICARCKKVRDDEAYWHSMETYLHTHLKLKLTHGLCPTCFAQEIKAIEEYAGPPAKF